jgi:uncharacterized protein YecE (DUF72 family)
LKEQARVFIRGIEPLVKSSKLAAVLVQFPFSFHYTPQNRRTLDRLCGLFEQFPVAVEFRNSEWQRESVYDGLQSRTASFVNVDQPSLRGLLVPSSIVTADTAYVRFHGRNERNWWTGDNASRYDYRYSETELEQWVPRIESMAQTAHLVIVSFNNHWKGQAVDNGRVLKRLLGQETEQR